MTNKSYGQKSPGYQPEESCKSNACTPPNTSPAEFIDHECDMVHIACTPVCFKGKFYIAKEGATGDPDAAANKENWLGSFDYIDGMFWKAMMECASPHPDAVEQLTYTVTTNNDGTQSFVSSDPNVPDIILNQPTPIPNTNDTCTITAFTDQTSGATTITETCRDKDGNVISTKEVFVIQAGAIDTINAIADPNADGQIWITRPDLSMVCTYDCDKIDKMICSLTPKSVYYKSDALTYRMIDGAQPVSADTSNGTITINKADVCPDGGACNYNGVIAELLLSTSQNRKDGLTEVNSQGTTVTHRFEVQGTNYVQGTTMVVDEAGSDSNGVPTTLYLAFDANDEINVDHIISAFPSDQYLEDAIARLIIKISACTNVNY